MTCAAEDRINRALFAITLQRGTGAWNLSSIEQILNGPECDCKPDATEKEDLHDNG